MGTRKKENQKNYRIEEVRLKQWTESDGGVQRAYYMAQKSSMKKIVGLTEGQHFSVQKISPMKILGLTGVQWNIWVKRSLISSERFEFFQSRCREGVTMVTRFLLNVYSMVTWWFFCGNSMVYSLVSRWLLNGPLNGYSMVTRFDFYSVVIQWSTHWLGDGYSMVTHWLHRRY